MVLSNHVRRVNPAILSFILINCQKTLETSILEKKKKHFITFFNAFFFYIVLQWDELLRDSNIKKKKKHPIDVKGGKKIDIF